MSPVVFPVSFEQLQASIDFIEIGEEQRSGNGYDVRAIEVRHPGGALGYRFSPRNATGRDLVYISDNELNADAPYASAIDWRARLVDFSRGAAVLIHDATYTEGEYPGVVGWGHSTHADAVELALDAGVERLVLFHHRPERTDDEMDQCVKGCQAMVHDRGAQLDVVAAAEGMRFEV